MARYAWKSTVKTGMLDEYVRRHDALWPEMAELLKKAGIRNYTIWNLGNDLFGYYECDDTEEANRIQAESDVVKRWDASMEPLMTGTVPMRQVFLLD